MQLNSLRIREQFAMIHRHLERALTMIDDKPVLACPEYVGIDFEMHHQENLIPSELKLEFKNPTTGDVFKYTLKSKMEDNDIIVSKLYDSYLFLLCDVVHSKVTPEQLIRNTFRGGFPVPPGASEEEGFVEPIVELAESIADYLIALQAKVSARGLPKTSAI